MIKAGFSISPPLFLNDFFMDSPDKKETIFIAAAGGRRETAAGSIESAVEPPRPTTKAARIDEHKRAEEALLESEERLRLSQAI